MDANSFCMKVDFTRFGVLPREYNEIRESQGKGVEKNTRGTSLTVKNDDVCVSEIFVFCGNICQIQNHLQTGT